MTLVPGVTVTLDTNLLPADELVAKGVRLGINFSIASVTERELGRDDPRVEVQNLVRTNETAVWDESEWDRAVFADESSRDRLEAILHIISNGSFPQRRDALSEPQRRQLRDAMILEAHVRDGRSIFVTNDHKGFIRHGRRERLESALGTRILSRVEFESLLSSAA